MKTLLLDHCKSWNVPLLRQVFSDDVTSRILNTPSIEQVQNDRLIWKAEKNGHYSVRSAYRLCVEELVDVCHLRQPGNWRDIWRLKVPPKVKHLIWRMCRGCLLTRIRLQDKGVSCPTRCVRCTSEHEDLNHIFFKCPFGIQVWNAAGLWFDVQHAAIHNDTATAAIFYLLEHCPINFKQRFTALCWSLWKHRNLKVWEDVDELSAHVVDRARVLINDWHAANFLSTETPIQAGAAQLQSSLGTASTPATAVSAFGLYCALVAATCSRMF